MVNPVVVKIINMNKIKLVLTFVFTMALSANIIFAQSLYTPTAIDTKTICVSPENPNGDKGAAGLTNKGAK